MTGATSNGRTMSARVFGLKRAQGRGVLMNLPADPDGPMMDIIEWVGAESDSPLRPTA